MVKSFPMQKSLRLISKGWTVLLRRLRFLVGFYGEGGLGFARNPTSSGAELGGGAHVKIVVDIPETVPQQAVRQNAVSD